MFQLDLDASINEQVDLSEITKVVLPAPAVRRRASPPSRGTLTERAAMILVAAVSPLRITSNGTLVKYYAVAEIDITDPSWVPEYVEHVTRLVEERGGRYLARTPQIERMEGDRTPPQIFLIIEWPSKAAAIAFYDSDDYRPYRERRVRGARNEFALVAGEDVSGVAQMP